jgi:hypothetical protein
MGSARGRARSQIVNQALKQGQREGQSPLARGNKSVVCARPDDDKKVLAAFMIMKPCRS